MGESDDFGVGSLPGSQLLDNNNNSNQGGEGEGTQGAMEVEKEYSEQKIRFEILIGMDEAEGYQIAKATKEMVEMWMEKEPDLVIRPIDMTQQGRIKKGDQFPEDETEYNQFFYWQSYQLDKKRYKYIVNFEAALTQQHSGIRKDIVANAKANGEIMTYLYKQDKHLKKHEFDSYDISTAGYLIRILPATVNIEDLQQRWKSHLEQYLKEREATMEDGDNSTELKQVPQFHIKTRTVIARDKAQKGRDQRIEAYVLQFMVQDDLVGKFIELIMDSNPPVKILGTFVPFDTRQADEKLFEKVVKTHNTFVNNARVFPFLGYIHWWQKVKSSMITGI